MEKPSPWMNTHGQSACPNATQPIEQVRFSNMLDEARAVFRRSRQRTPRFTAYAMLSLAAFRMPGLSLFPIGTFLGLALLPFTIRNSAPHVRILWVVTVLAAANGILLAATVPMTQGNPGGLAVTLGVLGWLVTLPAIVTACGWAFAQTGFWRGMLIISGGAFASEAIHSGDTWKYGPGVALSLVALVAASGSIWLARAVLVVAAVLSVLNDSRAPGMIALAVLLTSFVGERAGRWIAAHRTLSGVGTVLLLVPLTRLLTWAMTSGVLGADVQARTLAQTHLGQSVVAGGRPELAAAADLFAHHPFGFGVAVQPTPTLVGDAIAAAKAVGGDTHSDYFTKEVFAQRVDMHSIAANLWYHFGFIGLLLAIFIAIMLIGALAQSFSNGNVLNLAARFAIAISIWDLAFSPLGTVNRLIVGLCAASYILSEAWQAKMNVANGAS